MNTILQREEKEKLLNQKGIAIGYESVPGADHFFSNQLDKLSSSVESYVKDRLGHLHQPLAMPA